jgi:hypothetical protein
MVVSGFVVWPPLIGRNGHQGFSLEMLNASVTARQSASGSLPGDQGQPSSGSAGAVVDSRASRVATIIKVPEGLR